MTDMFVEVATPARGCSPRKASGCSSPLYTTKEGGMGMGLSLSRSIVEAHGGRLSAAPNEPNGAIFRFTLPVVEPSSRSEGVDSKVGRTKVPAILYADIIA